MAPPLPAVFRALVLASAALALPRATAALPPASAARTAIAAAIVESDAKFEERRGAVLSQTADVTTYAAKPVAGLPGEQTILQRDGRFFLRVAATAPADVKVLHDAVYSLAAFSPGFGSYVVNPIAILNTVHDAYQSITLNGQVAGYLIERDDHSSVLEIGPMEQRTTAPAKPEAAPPASADPAVVSLCTALFRMVVASAAYFPEITRNRLVDDRPDLQVFSVSKPPEFTGESFVRTMKATDRAFYAVIYRDPVAIAQVMAAIKALPARYGPAWRYRQIGSILEASRDGNPVIDFSNQSNGDGLLLIAEFVSGNRIPEVVRKGLDQIIAEGPRGFDGLTGQHLTSSATLTSHAVVTRTMWSDKMVVQTSDGAYPSLEAHWLLSNAMSDATYRALYADILARAEKGALVIEANVPMTHLFPDSRQLQFHANGMYFSLGYHMEWNGPRLKLQVSQIARPPWAHEVSETPQYATQSPSAPAPRASAPVVATMQHTCVRCDGRGSIETTDRYGHHVQTSCPICGGRGYTTN